MQKILSIIIPVYNGKKYIKGCLDQITRQLNKKIEVIIVCNGCVDNSESIASQYEKKFENITVVSTKTKGIVNAKKIGIEKSCGKYIAYIDVDDRITEDYIDLILTTIYEYHDIDCIVFDFYYETLDKNNVNYIPANACWFDEGYYSKDEIESIIAPNIFFEGKHLNKRNFYYYPWNKIFKREILEKHHCTDNTIEMFEDMAYVPECILDCESLIYLKKPLYIYNFHNQGSMHIDLKYDWYEAFNYCWFRFEESYIKKQISSKFIKLSWFAIFNYYKDNKDYKKINELIEKFNNQPMTQEIKLSYSPYFKLKLIFLLMRTNSFRTIKLLCFIAKIIWK